jgi:spore coat polysaccharide biosynthesis predicted glycosyltransferase SpsG
VQKNRNVVLHENVSKMSEIMLRSDISISAGGSTLYELCACGTPTLGMVIADNQIEIVDMLSAEGYITNIGWHSELSDREVLGSLSFCVKIMTEGYPSAEKCKSWLMEKE